MKRYIFLDGQDLQEVEAPICSAISAWLEETEAEAVLVNSKSDNEDATAGAQAWRLGLEMTLSKGKKLKAPIKFLYTLAKEYKRDFVVGVFDEQTGEPEDVCYFGNEEGAPDVFEISSYLGVKV